VSIEPRDPVLGGLHVPLAGRLVQRLRRGRLAGRLLVRVHGSRCWVVDGGRPGFRGLLALVGIGNADVSGGTAVGDGGGAGTVQGYNRTVAVPAVEGGVCWAHTGLYTNNMNE